MGIHVENGAREFAEGMALEGHHEDRIFFELIDNGWVWPETSEDRVHDTARKIVQDAIFYAQGCKDRRESKEQDYNKWRRS